MEEQFDKLDKEVDFYIARLLLELKKSSKGEYEYISEEEMFINYMSVSISKLSKAMGIYSAQVTSGSQAAMAAFESSIIEIASASFRNGFVNGGEIDLPPKYLN